MDQGQRWEDRLEVGSAIKGAAALRYPRSQIRPSLLLVAITDFTQMWVA